MKIESVNAIWLSVPIPESRQHVSDFGRSTSFDSVLVRVKTECGLVGHGEAKEEVGGVANLPACRFQCLTFSCVHCCFLNCPTAFSYSSSRRNRTV